MEKRNKKIDLVAWCISRIILPFFPIVIVIICCFIKPGSINLLQRIQNGELIIISFSIIVTALLNHELMQATINKSISKGMVYTMLFVAFSQLVAYTATQFIDQSKAVTVYITSGICVVASIVFSYRYDSKQKERNINE